MPFQASLQKALQILFTPEHPTSMGVISVSCYSLVKAYFWWEINSKTGLNFTTGYRPRLGQLRLNDGLPLRYWPRIGGAEPSLGSWGYRPAEGPLSKANIWVITVLLMLKKHFRKVHHQRQGKAIVPVLIYMRFPRYRLESGIRRLCRLRMAAVNQRLSKLGIFTST